MTCSSRRVSDSPALEIGPEFVHRAGASSVQGFWDRVPVVVIVLQRLEVGDDEIQYCRELFPSR